jgi:hypothetical protein
MDAAGDGTPTDAWFASLASVLEADPDALVPNAKR